MAMTDGRDEFLCKERFNNKRCIFVIEATNQSVPNAGKATAKMQVYASP